MRMITRLLLALALCIAIVQAAELSINLPPGPVGPQPTLTGKAPTADAKVYIVVNPVQTPQQFWVQKMASVDIKKNWICSIHVGDPGNAHADQKFIVVAVADPNVALHEGEVLSDWPAAKWVSQPVILTRK